MNNPLKIRACMILAAGRGIRMRELTENKPKPLIEIHQKPLIGHLMDKIQRLNLPKIVVNTCYKGDMIRDYLKQFPNILFSNETVALETGGGVKKALPLLLPEGENGFFVCNADPLWDEPSIPLLNALENVWNPEKMDILLSIVPKNQAFGHIEKGNYFIENNQLRRILPEETDAPYLFTGIQIMHPRIFKNTPNGAFSSRDLYDIAKKKQRLGFIIFDGNWFHVGTPEAILETEKIYDIHN